MDKNAQWIDWIVELQSLAQIGLTYCKDVYDRERHERLREISAEMMARTADLPLETPAPPSSRTTESFWCRRTTADGPCPAAGAM